MMNAFELEHYLIDPEKWDDRLLSLIPCNIRDELEGLNPTPIGIGIHPSCGIFVLGTGQGPFIMWTQNGD